MRTFKGYRWRYLFLERRPPEGFVKKYGLLLAQLLVNRGLEKPPSEEKLLLSASSLPHLEEATAKILKAVEENKNIFLFGDYDVDGLTSTTLMYKVLKKLGAKRVFPIVPERSEGYGILPPVVEKLKKFSPEGGLIVVLDNGTKEVETVKLALRLGFDVVIFDHHTPGEILPPTPLVNPKISPTSEGYLKDLSTVGLVYLFAKYLEKLGYIEGADSFLDLVALGTIADVSPLSPLNAKLVRRGLKALSMGETSSVGLRYLLGRLNLSQIGEHDVAFKLAPRLNAFGRMEKARRGLKFLITEDESLAVKLLEEMEELNTRRKSLTERATREVLEYYEKNPSKALVYVSPKLRKGIVGIIAGRVTSALGIPSVILATDGEVAVGSSRSPQGLNIVKVLERLSPLMERWGGHAQAAGLSVRCDRLEEFKSAFESEVENYEIETPTLDIDYYLQPVNLRNREKLIEDLKRLEPYGAGNPPPTFVFEDILTDFRETRYGYALHFERNGKIYLNTDGNGEYIPPTYRGRRLRVVYSVRQTKGLKLQVEDFAVL